MATKKTVSGGVALPSTSFRDPNCDIRVTGLGALSTEDYRDPTFTVSPKPSAQLVDAATGRTAAHGEFPTERMG